MPPNRPVPLPRSAYPHLKRMSTRWRDNDVYGHMNNVVYYEYFDTVVNGWLLEEGHLDFENGGVIGLVVSTACDYFASIAFPDEITAGLRVSRIGGSSVTYEIGLFRGDEGEAAAQGRFTHVYVEREGRRPTPLPEDLRASLETLLAPTG